MTVWKGMPECITSSTFFELSEFAFSAACFMICAAAQE